MISRIGFVQGDTVEFQNYQHAWIRGTVVSVHPAGHKVEGPGGRVVETEPSRVKVKYFDSFHRTMKIRELPVKRVRAVQR